MEYGVWSTKYVMVCISSTHKEQTKRNINMYVQSPLFSVYSMSY